MSDLKPCPHCGPMPAMPEISRDHIGYVRVTCGPCGSSSGIRPPSDPDGEAKVIAAWNRRASPTPLTTEGRGEREEAIEAAHWVIETTKANPHSRMALVARALLSSPRVEDVRRMREALEACAAPWDSGPTTVPAVFPLLSAEFQRRLNIAGEVLVSLSLPDGEGDKQATRAEDGPTAPTDRL